MLPLFLPFPPPFHAVALQRGNGGRRQGMGEKGHGIVGLKGTVVMNEMGISSFTLTIDRNSHKMNPIDVNDFLGLIVITVYRS